SDVNYASQEGRDKAHFLAIHESGSMTMNMKSPGPIQDCYPEPLVTIVESTRSS
ncbi:hypothetical protein HAX54_011901, partial [Datura stramonium]|nr:hypothetical protein [Datura stramonium]